MKTVFVNQFFIFLLLLRLFMIMYTHGCRIDCKKYYYLGFFIVVILYVANKIYKLFQIVFHYDEKCNTTDIQDLRKKLDTQVEKAKEEIDDLKKIALFMKHRIIFRFTGLCGFDMVDGDARLQPFNIWICELKEEELARSTDNAFGSFLLSSVDPLELLQRLAGDVATNDAKEVLQLAFSSSLENNVTSMQCHNGATSLFKYFTSANLPWISPFSGAFSFLKRFMSSLFGVNMTESRVVSCVQKLDNFHTTEYLFPFIFLLQVTYKQAKIKKAGSKTFPHKKYKYKKIRFITLVTRTSHSLLALIRASAASTVVFPSFFQCTFGQRFGMTFINYILKKQTFFRTTKKKVHFGLSLKKNYCRKKKN
ncbi:hypothetical protein RFI_38632 [Reticulomyxa filosa]|uniref:Uncharacterized protein n=1 Tax=Reticulomyxa filosa TaxID=46433 RepID=X6LDQ1_RETFI|nr:hypothetical protein RFI_38632 [Reticulomyxa filosa]|eukprot:ETN98854.1 hypothetical protein RFI_38632 [Reticulomyxa filosa]